MPAAPAPDYQAEARARVLTVLKEARAVGLPADLWAPLLRACGPGPEMEEAARGFLLAWWHPEGPGQ